MGGEHMLEELWRRIEVGTHYLIKWFCLSLWTDENFWLGLNLQRTEWIGSLVSLVIETICTALELSWF